MRKYIIAFIGFVFVFLLAYYAKCQLRFNIFESISLSKEFPFKYLQANPNPVVANPQAGVLLKDTFAAPFWSERNWSELWAREKGLVEIEYPADGADGTKCLLVKSNSAKDWALRHFKMISVKAGGRFGYEGRVKTTGNAKVILSVVTYNEDMKVMNWGYAAKTVNAAKDWVEVTNKFEIPQDVQYIRFGLSGSGGGKAWIDNVVFSKL